MDGIAENWRQRTKGRHGERAMEGTRVPWCGGARFWIAATPGLWRFGGPRPGALLQIRCAPSPRGVVSLAGLPFQPSRALLSAPMQFLIHIFLHFLWSGKRREENSDQAEEGHGSFTLDAAHCFSCQNRDEILELFIECAHKRKLREKLSLFYFWGKMSFA